MLSMTCVVAHINDFIVVPGLKMPLEFHTRILEVDSFEDFLYTFIFVG